MTTTITLHWWIVPIVLVIAALGFWYHGSKEGGIMGGITQFFIGAGLIVAAIVVIATKVVFG